MSEQKLTCEFAYKQGDWVIYDGELQQINQAVAVPFKVNKVETNEIFFSLLPAYTLSFHSFNPIAETNLKTPSAELINLLNAETAGTKISRLIDISDSVLQGLMAGIVNEAKEKGAAQ